MKFARRPNRMKQWLLSPFAYQRLPKRDGVQITFDDGPDPDHTPAVLDLLEKHGVSAAFFLLGERVVAESGIVRDIGLRGHLIGYHTYTHPRFGWLKFNLPERELKYPDEWSLPERFFFRPPYGQITPALLWALRKRKIEIVTWSLDSGDWRCRTRADAVQCVHEVLELIRPGDTILFHDTHPWIELILDLLLPGLTDRELIRRIDVRKPVAFH